MPEFDPVSLLVTPSYEKLNELWPLMVMPPTEPQPGASRVDVSMTPGSVFRVPMKSRPLQADVLDLVGGDRRRPLAALRLHAEAIGLHQDLLRQAGHLQRDRQQRHALGRRHDDALLHVRLEAGEGDGDVVGARQQVRHEKRARAVGHDAPHDARAGVRDCDTGPGHDRLRAVGDHPADLPGQTLRGGQRGRAPDRGQHGRNHEPPAMTRAHGAENKPTEGQRRAFT